MQEIIAFVVDGNVWEKNNERSLSRQEGISSRAHSGDIEHHS